MSLGVKQWESDPLFSAAEVVQDSADRMGSVFRLLMHELSLYKDDNPDPKLCTSIGYHRRDLATSLETTKWQLEDFERALNLSTYSDKSQMREEMIFRHEQFVRAIREQIIHVEKCLEDLVGYRMNKPEWVNLDEQDRDGLALFLSGGDHVEHFDRHDSDGNILQRFLDPATASTSKDGICEIVEHKSRETGNMKVRSGVHTSGSSDSNMRKVGSHSSTRMGLEALGSLQESSCEHGEDNNWDLEAHGDKPKGFFDDNKSRRFNNRTNLFSFFINLLSACCSRVARTYRKKLKDGEEQRHSPTYIDANFVAQGHRLAMRLASANRSFNGLCYSLLKKIMLQFQTLKARCQRSPYCTLASNRHSIILILATLSILIILVILVPYIA